MVPFHSKSHLLTRVIESIPHNSGEGKKSTFTSMKADSLTQRSSKKEVHNRAIFDGGGKDKGTANITDKHTA